ncbi:SEC-C metal-binding domain-containing protein [Crassaminicella profunda]|uniref:SEC-C metal-binding domain-containing protein n=1 Tax=Crassaminicella profunda TaxID=1286698 RepID=UPI001CA6879F|nr:SEC-C metal-binding domain-containing protein [Crassaminicella profunda]QZY57354.1 SEC-C domain-containing protein [Crassaminicella profunda]
MSLVENWRTIAYEHETQQSFDKFWNEYAKTEKKIYENVLENHGQAFEGVVKELTGEYETSNEYIMGFLDGINESLKEKLDLEEITEDSAVKLDIDFEKLYYNMLEAKADYLYTLPQWDEILDEQKRKEITKVQRTAKTVVKENKVGRNDPCPCGSGKKYKKCCGK